MPATDQLRHYVLFLGFGHSGHSLVGALLDAHPDAVIANEYDLAHALRNEPLTLAEVEQRLLAAGLAQSDPEAWVNTGYSYHVPGGWQGRVRRLEVLGDKKGGGTVRALMADPTLWDRMEALFGAKLRVYVVIRNPWDVVAARAYRRGRQIANDLSDDLILMAQQISQRLQVLGKRALLIRHEDFVADPEAGLTAVLGHVGLQPDAASFAASVSIVRGDGHPRRLRVEWPAGTQSYLAARLSAAPLFAGYAY